MNKIENQVAIPIPTESYHPSFVRALNDKFADRLVRTEFGAPFSNSMPVTLVGKAEKVMMISFFNGDNHRDSLVDLALLGNAFTTNSDAAGPNTNNFGVFYPFADLRGHDKDRKPIPDEIGRAIVQAQGVNNEVLANILNASGASWVGFLDMQNPWKSSKAFDRLGIELINLTANQPFVDYLVNNRDIYLNDELETVVESVDAGILSNAYNFTQKLEKGLNRNIEMAISLKLRIGKETESKIVSGNIKGKRVIIVDDSISSSGSLETIMEHQKEAEEIIIIATHPIFVEHYYKRMEKILEDPRVKLVMTANTVPEIRGRNRYSKPKLKTDGQKQVETLDISTWLANRLEVILDAPDVRTAKEMLANDVIEPQDPYDLIEKLTRIRYFPPPDTGIYEEGNILLFPKS